jgi:hypothetical protein
MNDWTPFAARFSGVTPLKMFTIDRPSLGAIYMVAEPILGDNPIMWQLTAITLRIVGALLFYWLLTLLWPSKKMEISAMAVLFLVYPGFLQTPSAKTFMNHFLCYAMGIGSIAFTIKAIKSECKKSFLVFTVLSLFLAVPYLFIYEYMIGLEGVRILLMGYVYFQKYGPNWKSWIMKVLRLWIPYFLNLSFFLVWRVFIFKSTRSATDMGALAHQYLADPFGMLFNLIYELVRGILNSVFFAWVVPLYNQMLSIQSKYFIISVLLSLVAVSLWLYLNNTNNTEILKDETKNNFADDHAWAVQAMILGGIIVFFTLFPPIITGRKIIFKNILDRYSFQAIIGTSIFLIGLFTYYFKRTFREVLIILLLGSAVILHFNNTIYFRDYWQNQVQLWWQTTWRIPDFEDETVFVTLLPQGYRLMEDFDTVIPAGLIYPVEPNSIRIISEVLNSETAVQIEREMTTHRNYRTIEYDRDFRNTLIASMPSSSSCVHFVDGEQRELSIFDDPLVQIVAEYSKIDRIILDAPTVTPPEVIFGSEPEHNWCYYYQKASLARQKGDWEEVVRLTDEALEKGYKPVDVAEWMPMYEGLWNQKRYETAKVISDEIQSNLYTHQHLCGQLENITGNYSSEQVFEELVANLCGK